MRKHYVITTAQVLEKVNARVAPLPSQAAYMKGLPGLMVLHINSNLRLTRSMFAG